MGSNTAFFYGTLMAPGVLYRVIHGKTPSAAQLKAKSSLTFQSGLLHHYRRHKVKNADYPAIIPDSNPNSSVRGTIVSGLTDLDLLRLDIFEGDQYVRMKVKLDVLAGTKLDESATDNESSTTTETNETILADTYIWREDVDLLDPNEWDFEVFKAQKMRRWMGEAESESDTTNGNSEENVQVDEGFADVDRAVAEMENDPPNQNNGKSDGMGGRGSHQIWKQIEEAAA